MREIISCRNIKKLHTSYLIVGVSFKVRSSGEAENLREAIQTIIRTNEANWYYSNASRTLRCRRISGDLKMSLGSPQGLLGPGNLLPIYVWERQILHLTEWLLNT